MFESELSYELHRTIASCQPTSCSSIVPGRHVEYPLRACVAGVLVHRTQERFFGLAHEVRSTGAASVTPLNTRYSTRVDLQ